ncbi:MAG: hypothetical protein Q4A52_07215 [Bacillota bacterium]|nr:hypothetical protein [Bacillota bacterium]
MKLFDRSQREQRLKEQEELIYRNWGPISRQGRLSYAIKQATYRWALPTYAIYSVLMYFLSRFNAPGMYPYGWSQALIALVIFMVCGFFFGMYLFNRNERIYRKRFPYKSKKK